VNAALLLAASALAVAHIAAAPAATPDAYQALQAMEGRWIATTSHGRSQTIENRCARTGLFFACEQVVGGKAAALVVFLPRESGERRLVFHTQTLTAAGDRPGPWRELTIEAERWTYSDIDKPAHGQLRKRTVDTYSGPDAMHVEIQASTDDERWTTTASEDLARAP
jgi:hypothetical protein